MIGIKICTKTIRQEKGVIELTRNDVTVLQLEVVVRPDHVARNNGSELATVLQNYNKL